MAENAWRIEGGATTGGGRVTVPIWGEAVGAALQRLGPIAALGVPAAAGEQMELLSASANDTAAGSGAQSVRLIYLDASFNVQVETVATATTPAVSTTTATDILRLLGAEVVATGAGNENAGLITVQKLTAGGIRGGILAGHNSWLPGTFTVPAGFQARVLGAYMASGDAGSNNCEVLIQAEMDKYTGLVTADKFATLGAMSFRRDCFWQPKEGATVLVPAQAEIRALGLAAAAVTLVGHMDVEVFPV